VSLTSDEFLADVAAVYTGDESKGAFGAGRLIAPGLVLTAGHVVDYPTQEAAARTGWKVSLLRDRAADGTWKNSPHDAELIWRHPGDVDLALLQVAADLTPTLNPVFASYGRVGEIAVVAWGFPEAWFGKPGTLADYSVRGNLRIGGQLGPYLWSVPAADKPDNPRGWKGMSGAAACYIGPNDKVYLLGVVEDVPPHFSEGLLRVAKLSDAFAKPDFCEHLRSALGKEPRVVPVESRMGAVAWASMGLVPVSSESSPPNYVDRPEITRPLLIHLLDDASAPYGRAMISVVHGLGGSGKTTVARWLIWQLSVRERFRDGQIWITIGREPSNALAITNGIISQLHGVKPQTTEEAAKRVLTTLLQDRAILFVIDDVWYENSLSAEVAKALIVPSPRCHFLVTTRFPQIVSAMQAKDFPLDEMNLNQAIELTNHVLNRQMNPAEKPLAERLWKAVAGHPLALELAAARIREGTPWSHLLNALAAEITRLEALQEQDDDLFAGPVSADARNRRKSVRASLLLSVRYLGRDWQRLFAWLGIFAENSTITPSMAATLWSTDELTAHRQLRRLREAGLLTASEDTYRLHDLMRALARELLRGPETPAREGDIAGFGLPVPDATREFLEHYKAKIPNGLWHTLPEDGYIHEHLAFHFEEACWLSELEKLLCEESADGMCGWYWARERLDQTAGFLADVHRIWRYADAVLMNRGQNGNAVAIQLHCALIITTLNSLTATIPRVVLKNAVRYGLISMSNALALTRQHVADAAQVKTFIALADDLPLTRRQSLLSEALDVARRIDQGDKRSAALAVLAERLSDEEQGSVLKEALSAAESIVEEPTRSYALGEIAKRLPAEEALGVAHTIDHEPTRAEALAEVATRLPVDQGLDLACTIDDTSMRGKALAGLISRLPPEKALALAHSIDDKEWRAGALAEVAQRLPAETRHVVQETALSVALAIDYGHHRRARARALAEVARRLPTEEIGPVFDQALSAARTGRYGTLWDPETIYMLIERLPVELAVKVANKIPDLEARATALAGLAPRLSADDRHSVLSKALTDARAIDDRWKRSRALAEVAQWLPIEEQRNLFSEALKGVRYLEDGRSRDWALRRVAERLPPTEATAVARNIKDERIRNAALAAAARRLPPQEALAIVQEMDSWYRGAPLVEIAGRLCVQEALAVARSIDDAEARADALMMVAQRLPSKEQSGALEEALTVARGISKTLVRAQVLGKVAQRLPDEERSTVLNEAFFTASRDREHFASASGKIFAELAVTQPPEQAIAVARRVPEDARVTTLQELARILPAQEALEAAKAIDIEFERSWALANVVPRLPTEQALEIARGINAVGTRAHALAEVARRLPVDQALTLARSIDLDWARASALADVAELLPAEAQGSVLAEALSIARGIGDSGLRAQILAAVAQRFPASDQASIYEEALRAARNIGDEGMRSRSLSEIAQQLPAEQAVVVAREISDNEIRVEALGEVALRLPAEQGLAVALAIDPRTSSGLENVARELAAREVCDLSPHQWAQAVHATEMRNRLECVLILAALLPLIVAFGGDTAVRGLERSITAVGRWWP
jgi:hypothetical protein